MKIVVDGFNLALEKGTGVSTYARNLTYCLHDMGHEVSVLYGSRRAPDKTQLMKEIAFFDENVVSPSAAIKRWRGALQILVPRLSRKAHPLTLSGAVIHKQFSSRMPHFDALWNSPHIFDHAPIHFKWFGGRLNLTPPSAADVMHWTYPLPLRMRAMKNIYTLHDLVPLRLPYTTLDRKRDYYKLMQLLVKHADHIVTVSETSKKDIISMLGVEERKITNTYQSVSIPKKYLDVPRDTLKDELKGTFRLSYKGYLLFYGSIEPKKNIGRIIEAYLASNIDIPLVIVGAQAWKSENELKLLVEDNIRSLIQLGPETLVKRKVIRLDYASFPQLVSLIRGAKAVLFPSLYEGFGLPILEGMICQTPVLTSNVGSMQEIAGSAAVLVDPYNPREIKDGMLALVNNPDLCADMIHRGRAVAERFSPEAYRQRLGTVYAKICQSNRGTAHEPRLAVPA